MALCSSVRKKGSTMQCGAKPLKGHTLCGTHARSKRVTLWSELYLGKADGLVKFQANVRRWLVQRRLALAGPGVLCRKNLTNTEDLETCEESDREHPMTYFAFEENGKIWWFHFPTLWKWSIRSFEPTNPYTKTPLSYATRKRLRAMWSYNRRRNLDIPAEPNTLEDRIRCRWNVICQMFVDNGFGDIDPRIFTHLLKPDYIAVFRMLRSDLEIVFTESSAIRKFANGLIKRLLSAAHVLPPAVFCLHASYILQLILMFPKDPYVLSFTTLSALYRC